MNKLQLTDSAEANKLEPDSPWIQFEVMDRAYTIQTMLEELLGEHPGLSNGQLQAYYDRAETALADLYSEAGRISCTSQDDENRS